MGGRGVGVTIGAGVGVAIGGALNGYRLRGGETRQSDRAPAIQAVIVPAQEAFSAGTRLRSAATHRGSRLWHRHRDGGVRREFCVADHEAGDLAVGETVVALVVEVVVALAPLGELVDEE